MSEQALSIDYPTISPLTSASTGNLHSLKVFAEPSQVVYLIVSGKIIKTTRRNKRFHKIYQIVFY